MASLDAQRSRTTPRSWSRFILTTFTATLLFTSTLVQALDASSTVTLSFLDETGAVVKTQDIPYQLCQNLDIDGTFNYTSISALNNNEAAFNLYTTPYCVTLSMGTVQTWSNVDLGANTYAVRWEGNTNKVAPGTVLPLGLPKNLQSQKVYPSFDFTSQRAKTVVGIVSGLMIVGVSLGLWRVYRAATYKPPPKPAKNKRPAGMKKIKKKNAYYKKKTDQDYEDEQRRRDEDADDSDGMLDDEEEENRREDREWKRANEEYLEYTAISMKRTHYGDHNNSGSSNNSSTTKLGMTGAGTRDSYSKPGYDRLATSSPAPGEGSKRTSAHSQNDLIRLQPMENANSTSTARNSGGHGGVRPLDGPYRR